jgi:signal peptidase II
MIIKKLNKKDKLRNILIVILLVTNVGCDQISKYYVRENLEYNVQKTVIHNIITITKVENTGAFLSLGDHLPRFIYIFLMIILPLIVLGYALYYLLTSDNLSKLLIVGITLIVGGGLGNIIDRIIYGSVTDFLYFDFYLFHTGVVNLADITLTTGFFILIYEFIVSKRLSKSNDE